MAALQLSGCCENEIRVSRENPQSAKGCAGLMRRPATLFFFLLLASISPQGIPLKKLENRLAKAISQLNLLGHEACLNTVVSFLMFLGELQPVQYFAALHFAMGQ